LLGRVFSFTNERKHTGYAAWIAFNFRQMRWLRGFMLDFRFHIDTG
jgi:hypothetical protein